MLHPLFQVSTWSRRWAAATCCLWVLLACACVNSLSLSPEQLLAQQISQHSRPLLPLCAFTSSSVSLMMRRIYGHIANGTIVASSWGPVAWVVTGELFPLKVRAKCLSMTTATNWLLNFAIAYSTPYMVNEGDGYANLQSKVFFVRSLVLTLHLRRH
jgi:hypothetical protein